MPTHKHSDKEHYGKGTASGWCLSVSNEVNAWAEDKQGNSGSSWGHNHTFTGTQQTINHMNPYLVAYCFKRVL